VLQRLIAAQRNDARYAHYTDLAQHWLKITKLRLPLVACNGAVWTTQRLVVSVRPDFALANADGEIPVLKLWLKEQPLSKDAANACLRLLTRHMPSISPGGTPVVVDVRRERIYQPTKRPLKRGFDEWLESEAEAMGSLWLRLSAA
jgi:hypothetical protein